MLRSAINERRYRFKYDGKLCTLNFNVQSRESGGEGKNAHKIIGDGHRLWAVIQVQRKLYRVHGVCVCVSFRSEKEAKQEIEAQK